MNHIPTKVIAEIPLSGPETFADVPMGAQVLCVKVDRGRPTVFLLCDAKPLATEPRKFVAIPGAAFLKGEIIHCNYLETLIQQHLPAIHVYEVPIQDRFGDCQKPTDWNPVQIIEQA